MNAQPEARSRMLIDPDLGPVGYWHDGQLFTSSGKHSETHIDRTASAAGNVPRVNLAHARRLRAADKARLDVVDVEGMNRAVARRRGLQSGKQRLSRYALRQIKSPARPRTVEHLSPLQKAEAAHRADWARWRGGESRSRPGPVRLVPDVRPLPDIVRGLKVAGTSFVDAPRANHAMVDLRADGSPWVPVDLDLRPDTPTDPDAVACVLDGFLLGYVPRSVSARLAPELRNEPGRWSAKVRLITHSQFPKNPGIELALARKVSR